MPGSSVRTSVGAMLKDLSEGRLAATRDNDLRRVWIFVCWACGGASWGAQDGPSRHPSGGERIAGWVKLDDVCRGLGGTKGEEGAMLRR